MPRTVISPRRQSMSSRPSPATSPARRPIRDSSSRTARSRRPVAVAGSQEASIASTCPGSSARGSPASACPAGDGTAPASGTARMPSTCRKRSRDRSAVTIRFADRGCLRAWSSTNARTSAAVSWLQVQVPVAFECPLLQERAGQADVQRDRPRCQAPLGRQVGREPVQQQARLRRRFRRRERGGPEPAEVAQQRAECLDGPLVRVSRRAAGREVPFRGRHVQILCGRGPRRSSSGSGEPSAASGRRR